VKCLLDTHFLLWVVVGATRLDEFDWLGRYAPWGVSPLSFLEIQCLSEVGRVEVDIEAFTTAVMEDPRFVVDEVPLVALVRHSLSLSWTRDPFDRLLSAHSAARRVPLCSADRRIREHHQFTVPELRD
jgi:PIN domain nuclease of toxin-antitoxin system